MRKLSCFTLLAILVVFCGVTMVSAQNFSLQPYLSGLSSPLLLTNAHDGTRRNFVVQQGGTIKVILPGSTTATDFMTIPATKLVAGGEQGLLGLAFHPQFATNGYFFVNYTRAADGATVIARYKATNNNTIGDPNSERILLVIPQPYSNHNGGMIEFRQDNGVYNLYIGMGDGGSGNDPQNRAQNPNELLGKFLRITPDVSGNDANAPYTVPADNPYVGVDGADEIYALGVRNPFRWSFNRGTGQLWAGDVGQGAREEIDIIQNGGNYGWRIMEGNICTPNVSPANCTPPANYIAPLLDYTHVSGRCSITGGYVYRGTQGALPTGAYIFGDYCSGEIWMLQNTQQTLLQDTTLNISSFGEDESGELYVVNISGGTVLKFASLRPTAASVTISGRATTANGRGIRNVRVTMTDSSGNIRMATTTTFGYYHFEDVTAGETLVFTVRAKNFQFSQPTQVLSVSEDASNINFVADPQ